MWTIKNNQTQEIWEKETSWKCITTAQSHRDVLDKEKFSKRFSILRPDLPKLPEIALTNLDFLSFLEKQHHLALIPGRWIIFYKKYPREYSSNFFYQNLCHDIEKSWQDFLTQYGEINK